jgi:hypothetical protein
MAVLLCWVSLMLNVAENPFMQSVVKLNVILLNVNMLRVVVPFLSG